MIDFKNDILLGNGIYTIPDLALILQLPKKKVRRWLDDFYNERLGKRNEGRYSWGEGRNKATNFLTLIEFYVFYKLREYGFSTYKILEVHQHISKELKTAYPFASHKLLVDGKEILYALEDDTWVGADKSSCFFFIPTCTPNTSVEFKFFNGI